MNNNKFLFAAVIILGLGIVYYFLYTYNYNEAKDTMSMVMPDYMLAYAQFESDNLTLYENKDYGFSVGYPSSVNWTVREYDLLPDQVVVIEGPENVQIGIEVKVSPGYISPAAAKESFDEYVASDPDIKLLQSNITTLFGYSAVQATFYQNTLTSLEVGGLTKPQGIDGNTELYDVYYMADPAYFNKYLPEVSEILKSFKIGLE